jgi:hypothetical protein
MALEDRLFPHDTRSVRIGDLDLTNTFADLLIHAENGRVWRITGSSCVEATGEGSAPCVMAASGKQHVVIECGIETNGKVRGFRYSGTGMVEVMHHDGLFPPNGVPEELVSLIVKIARKACPELPEREFHVPRVGGQSFYFDIVGEFACYLITEDTVTDDGG